MKLAVMPYMERVFLIIINRESVLRVHANKDTIQRIILLRSFYVQNIRY